MGAELQPTPQEQLLIDSAGSGAFADFRSEDQAANKPETGAHWGLQRTIRADILCALAVGANPRWPVHAHGVRLRGAKIVGALDFQASEIPHPLALTECYIAEPINLEAASGHSIALTGSHVVGIKADGLRTRYSFFLDGGFIAKDEVWLGGAHIGGILYCSGGTFEGRSGIALGADQLRVEGGVFLGAGFRATGEVKLLGAKVGGIFWCLGGTFENPSGRALIADRLSVAGSAFLGKGFKATGEVGMLGAKIGGNLECQGGTFENGNGPALSADRLSVEGGAFLGDGFRVKGEVRLVGGIIGANFECSGGKFENPNGHALSADRLRVEGSALLDDGFEATGEVRLLGAKIGGDLACNRGTFENPTGDALNAAGMSIEGGAFLDGGFRATGAVRLVGARIGRLIDDPASWPAPGSLLINGLVYESLGGTAPTDASRRRDWLNRQPKDQFRPQPYEQLVRVLRQMGHDDDAREIAIAKHAALRKSGQLRRLGRLWNLILAVTVRYGYRPARILLWMAPLVLIGSGVFSRAYTSCLMAPTAERVYLDKQFQCSQGVWNLPRGYPPFHSGVYSLDVFFPVVDLKQKAYWQPDETTPQGAAYRLYFWIHTVVGWGLTGIVLAGFSRLVKRD